MSIKKNFGKLVAGFMVGSVLAAPITTSASQAEIDVPELAETFNIEMGLTPKNVIVMIPDGMGTSNIGALRAYLTGGYEIIEMDKHLVGSMISLPNNGEDGNNITDSAAAGTAMATGSKTYNGSIGMSVDGEELVNLSQVAKEMGKSVGSVVTCDVGHATPAAFLAHVENRNDKNAIVDQYLDDGLVDVVLGGGTSFFDREDRNLTQDFIDAGFEYVETKTDLENAPVENGKLLGLFAETGMPKYWDMDEDTPSLADMTTKALDVLSQNEKGFFMLVEGSQVDWANHANDIAGQVSDAEDFNNAFTVAVDFARENGEILVLAAADHDTGGFAMAGMNSNGVWDPSALQGMSGTPEAIAAAVRESGSLDTLKDYIDWKFTSSELQAMEDSLVTGNSDEAVYSTIIDAVNLRTNSGWTTGDHSAGEVSLYAYGPGWEKYVGINDNTDIANHIKDFWGYKQ